MELALAEKSVYLPPLVVGALFVYRLVFGGLMTNHPILKPYIVVSSILSSSFDNMYSSVSSLFSKPTNALVINQTSVSILNTLANQMSLVVVSLQRMLTTILRSVLQIRSTIIQSVYAIVTSVTSILASIRFHFHTVTQQTYNTSSNLFTALQGKVTEIQTFFYPPPKSFLDKAQIGLLVVGSLIILGVTVYFLSTSRTKTITLPEPEKVVETQEEPAPVRRNPVRRKTKAA